MSLKILNPPDMVRSKDFKNSFDVKELGHDVDGTCKAGKSTLTD